MPTLTATPVTLAGLPGVLLVVDGLTADTDVAITRDPAGPAGAAVRGAHRTLPAGGALAVTDGEAPFGVALTYTATLRPLATPEASTDLTATVAALTPTATGVAYTDVDGRVAYATLVEERDRRARARASVLWPAGRRAPVILEDFHQSDEWTVVLSVADLDRQAALEELLTTPGAVLVRALSPSCHVTDGWCAALDVTVTRPVRAASHPLRWTEVVLLATDTPDPSLELVGATLLDLHEWEPTTLDALAGRAPTLLGLTVAVTLASV